MAPDEDDTEVHTLSHPVLSNIGYQKHWVIETLRVLTCRKWIYDLLAPEMQEALQHARQESSAPVGRDGYARLDTAD